MFSPFERMVARRYLGSKKAEGFVSVIAALSFFGIMLGVATLIIVMSVMNGFREELFSRILGLNGHMNVYALQGPLYDYEFMRSRVMSVDGVADAAPIIESQSLVSKNGVSNGVMIRGIEWKDFFNRPLLRNSVIAGKLDDFQGHVVAVGSVLAEKMRIRVGDEVVLTSPQVKSTPFGSMPRQSSYKVAFIFDVGMHEYNGGFIFMPLKAAQTFFQFPGAVTSLEIFLKNPDDLPSIRKGVETLIAGQAGVYDWQDLNQSFFNALNVERNVMFLILTLIIIVAALNIISSMIMLVKDKSHDIAIMRTMGATRANMMKIFMLTGASIGVFGTLAGALAGTAFALNIQSIRVWLESLLKVNLFNAEIYFLSQLPAIVEWDEVLGITLMAFVLSILATLYPAWRASRLDPVEALRYE